MSIQNCNSRIHLRSFRSAEIFYVYSFLVLLSCAAAQEKDKNSAPPPPNPYALDTNFNPSMAIIIVVLISAFFFMGFFSVYIRQCAGEGSTRAGGSVRRTGPPGRSRRAARGLDPAVIETFPTFLYSIVKGLKIGKGTLECAVCLNEFEDEETLRLLPKCDHVFHPECIDAWLASHTTCPVCRANLAADSTVAENTAGVMDAGVGVTDSGSESDDEDHRYESVVDINENEDNSNSQRSQQPEVINPSLLPIQNRPVRLGSTRKKIFGKFPRSHSTGHSLIQPGENCDRYTLRLPEEVRKQIMLNRTTSCVSFPTVDRTFSRRSSRRGYRGAGVGGGEGSSRGKYYQFWKLEEKAKSDRWVFSMAPPFLSRATSLRSPKGADGEGSVNSKNFLTSVKKPFDCLSGKFDGNEEASSRPRPPV